MNIITGKSETAIDKQVKDGWFIHGLRQPGELVDPDQVQVGGYYIYKEKFGMVTIVKVIEKLSENGWSGFRLMIKRVLYSPWPVQKGTVFEAGYYTKLFSYPTSWHLEPCMSLIKK
ncbi:hypothetical protein TherJR_1296 [Thermincola potens JR]|uniref:Uncharacterized protein n=2 Tax=Thermincola TaxID=278993 RepID=D5XET5_THEPJ|nr:hypothetical protein TherJR_1296 [Thermincola potens JR]